jgi:uncharacterized protein (TIGR02266 family)
MKSCPACRQSIDADARFCGHCGFRLAPISPEEHRKLSESLSPLREEAPIPLTRVKGPAARTPRPRLEVIEESPSVQSFTARPSAPNVSSHLSASTVEKAIRLVAAEPVMPSCPAPTVEKAPPRVAVMPSVPMPVAAPTVEKAPPRVAVVPSGPPIQERSATVHATDRPDRLSRRFPLKVEVSYASEHNFYTGFMENLSSGGLFVATHTPSTIGENVEVSFTVPGLEGICTAACRVRWVREYNQSAPDTIPGMGLQFIEIEPAARAAIELFIRHRDPIFFDDE